MTALDHINRSTQQLTKTTTTNNSTFTRGLHMLILVALIFCFCIGSGAFAADMLASERNRDRNSSSRLDKMNIHIGSKTFTATLYDNPTVTEFKAMLPLTLEMSELNGNEKYFHLPTDLPTDAANPGTIRAGDLMLWRSNSLVLFYKTFRTSYSYTKLGRIDNASELATAVGSGSVTVRFELERNDNLPRASR
jgi:hypothetical protein